MKKVHQEQRSVLIIEQSAVAGPIPRGANPMQMVKQRPQEAKIL
jgi:hypothetical protein